MSAQTFPKRIRKFTKPPEDCPPEMVDSMEDLVNYQCFLELVIFKIKRGVEIIIDVEGEEAVMYIDKRRHLMEARTPYSPNESFLDLESRLVVNFFGAFQCFFGNPPVINLLYFINPRHTNIIADYYVHYLIIMEILETTGCRDDIPLANTAFWSLYEDTISREIEVNDAPWRPGLQDLDTETPLHPRQVDICDIFAEIAKAKDQDASRTFDIFEQPGVSFPFDATPMPNITLMKFFYARVNTNVSGNVKAFLGEIRRSLATEMQLERVFRRKTDGYGFESVFVLSMRHLEWLATAEGRCEIGQKTSVANIKQAIRDLESSLSDDYFALVVHRLNFPDWIDIESYDRESCREFGRIALILVEHLRILRMLDGTPEGEEYWDSEEWKAISAKKWKEEIENSDKLQEIQERKMKTPKSTPIRGAATIRRGRKRKQAGPEGKAFIKEWLELKLEGKKSVTVLMPHFDKHFKRQLAAPRKKICRFLEAIMQETGTSLKISQEFSEKCEGGEILAGLAYDGEDSDGEGEMALRAKCRSNDLTDDMTIIGVNVFRRLQDAGCLSGEGCNKVFKKRLVDIEEVVTETAALIMEKLQIPV